MAAAREKPLQCGEEVAHIPVDAVILVFEEAEEGQDGFAVAVLRIACDSGEL